MALTLVTGTYDFNRCKSLCKIHQIRSLILETLETKFTIFADQKIEPKFTTSLPLLSTLLTPELLH